MKNLFLGTITILLLVCTSTSFGFVVFDPVNYGQNAISAAEAIKITKNTFDSLKELKDTYNKVKDNYNLTLQNLQNLKDIQQLLSDVDGSVNNYSGSSQLSSLNSLDPNSGNYAETRDQILNEYYQSPLKPEDIQARLQGSVSQNQIDAMKSQAKQENQDHQELVDAVDESAHENVKAKERAKHIQEYNKTISQLGEKSELKTQQTIAAELNLHAEQNEQLIEQQNQTLKYMRMQQAQIESERAKQTKAQLETFQKSINQGKSGLGRDKWGKL
jgi:hypothetical protein